MNDNTEPIHLRIIIEIVYVDDDLAIELAAYIDRKEY